MRVELTRALSTHAKRQAGRASDQGCARSWLFRNL
jgi:hypothetical protein